MVGNQREREREREQSLARSRGKPRCQRSSSSGRPVHSPTTTHSREFVSFRFSFSSTYLPRWYRIELIAVKKNSETISTLPLRVISVAVSVVLAMVVERCGRRYPSSLLLSGGGSSSRIWERELLSFFLVDVCRIASFFLSGQSIQ